MCVRDPFPANSALPERDSAVKLGLMTSEVLNQLTPLLKTPTLAELGPGRRAGTLSEGELTAALEAVFARTRRPAQAPALQQKT